MPVELGVWRIDGDVRDVEFVTLDYEHRLEDILAAKIEIASPNWLIVGRQVRTSFDKIIDLLAIDRDGNLVVLELKRDKTYRDIVAQTLDYGMWVKELTVDEISVIYRDYCEKYDIIPRHRSLDEAFKETFSLRQMPEEINDGHELVIVASALDPSTERVVRYLKEYHQVPINAIFFHVFKDGDHEYLSRVWLSDPTTASDDDRVGPEKQEWNGEYYVSYNAGPDPIKNRSWNDAVNFRFISAGGGPFYSRTLQLLEPGGRIWVNAPGIGYLGVGIVQDTVKRVDEFKTSRSASDPEVPILQLKDQLERPHRFDRDEDRAEHFVKVKWIGQVPIDKPIKEKGFFGNQNTVAKPRVKKWVTTVEKLKTRFGITDQQPKSENTVNP